MFLCLNNQKINNMKKFLFMGAIAAMLLGTASCSNDMEPQLADGTVQFKIELPGAVESRAISDGMTADELTIAVYKEDGTELGDLKTVKTNVKHETTVNFQLVKGQTYKFAFWWQKSGAPYDFNTANKKITVSYEGATANDESRDAFYAFKTLTVTGPMSETVYLTRPFAQLNFGASDVAAAKAAGVVAANSYVQVKGVATEFNLETGMTGETTTDVEFALAALPSNPAKLTVEGTQYDWMAMNYFLVPNNEATIETTLKLYTENEANAVREVNVTNVPVQKNHRTNIVGNLFTEDVNFNIIIDERFDQPDYNVDANGRPFLSNGQIQVGTAGETYTSIADAIEAANGETIYLGAGTYDEAINVASDQTVSISSAGNLTANDVVISQPINTVAGATLEVTGIKVTSDAANTACILAEGEGTNVVLNDVETSGRRGVNVFDGANVTIKNSKIVADKADGSNYSRGISLSGENNTVTIEASEITTTYYAINLVTNAANNNISISDCNINGWAILNVWGDSNTFTIDNCKMNSYNFTTNPTTNAFAALVTNADADNNTFNINNSNIDVSSKATSPQYLMLLGGHDNVYNGANIEIIGKNTNTNGYILGLKQTGATYTFNFDSSVKGTWDGEAFSF